MKQIGSKSFKTTKQIQQLRKKRHDKELLKLKELEAIQGVRIGDFTYWNLKEKY